MNVYLKHDKLSKDGTTFLEAGWYTFHRFLDRNRILITGDTFTTAVYINELELDTWKLT